MIFVGAGLCACPQTPSAKAGGHIGPPLRINWTEFEMIERIIEYSARNRVIILMIFALVIAWGVWS
ncbi:MAG TPA: hypothetical protein VF799_05650, partial [Geobacteraceae bacterium]